VVLKKSEIEMKDISNIGKTTNVGVEFDTYLFNVIAKAISDKASNYANNNLINNIDDVKIEFITSVITSHLKNYFSQDSKDDALNILAGKVSNKVIEEIILNNDSDFDKCYYKIIEAGLTEGLGKTISEKFNYDKFQGITSYQHMQFNRLEITIDKIYKYLTDVSKYAEDVTKKLLSYEEDEDGKTIRFPNISGEAVLIGSEYSFNKDNIFNLKKCTPKMGIKLEDSNYYYKEALKYILLECDSINNVLGDRKSTDKIGDIKDKTDKSLKDFVNKNRELLFKQCFSQIVDFISNKQELLEQKNKKVQEKNYKNKVYNTVFIIAGLAGGAAGVALGGGVIIAECIICPPVGITTALVAGVGIVGLGVAGGSSVSVTSGGKLIYDDLVCNQEVKAYIKFINILNKVNEKMQVYVNMKYPDIDLGKFDICIKKDHEDFATIIDQYKSECDRYSKVVVSYENKLDSYQNVLSKYDSFISQYENMNNTKKDLTKKQIENTEDKSFVMKVLSESSQTNQMNEIN
jgi:hypothetical protein